MYPSIDFNRVRMNQRQRLAYQALTKEDQLKYLLSFFGLKDKGLSPDRQIIRNTRYHGKVHNSPGEPLAAWHYERRKLYDPLRTKEPLNDNDDWIGVEIECFLSRNDFDNGGGDVECECECTCTCDGTCSVGNCRCECNGDCRDNCECSSGDDSYVNSVADSIKRAKIKNIQVVDDGSLSPDDDDKFGIEIKVLFRMSDYTNLEKICEWLASHDATVNTTCGLHVHLDARNVSTQIQNEYKNKLPFSEGNFVFNIDKSLKYLAAMLPKSRQNNTFCKYGYSFEDRYSMINCTALEKHGTIEMRAHSGTVNFTKIINWVRILYAVKSAKSVRIKTFNDWTQSIGLTEKLIQYAKERVSKFTPLLLTNEDDILTESTVSTEDSEMAA